MQRELEMDRLFESAYESLCRVARGIYDPSGSDPAAIVHETYLRIRRRDHCCVRERFLFLMTLAMKTVARDRRRRAAAAKRGGGAQPAQLGHEVEEARPINQTHEPDVEELREFMQSLAQAHPNGFTVLTLHDLRGETIAETAKRMGISESRVRSYRRTAIRWLRDSLRTGDR